MPLIANTSLARALASFSSAPWTLALSSTRAVIVGVDSSCADAAPFAARTAATIGAHEIDRMPRASSCGEAERSGETSNRRVDECPTPYDRRGLHSKP